MLNLKIGTYVAGLHEKFNTVRFIDAANMATGFGGTGTLRTQPNEFEDGYLEADYDGGYTAVSHAEKMAHMAKWLRPYPWNPGTVPRAAASCRSRNRPEGRVFPDADSKKYQRRTVCGVRLVFEKE